MLYSASFPSETRHTLAGGSNLIFHRETIQIEGFRISLKVFRAGQRLFWNEEILGRLCVLLGGGMLETRASGEDRYALSDVVYKPPEDRPRLRFCNDGARTLTVELEPTRARALREAGFPVDRPFSNHSGICTGLALRIYRELRAREEATRLVLEGLTLELLGEAFRLCRKIRRTKPPKWLIEVRDRIHDEFGRRLTLTDCARAAGVHPIHLAQSFRAHFGDSFGRYIRRMRIEFASRQILETDHTLSEVALAAGFSDQSHLSNSFKSATGYSPKQFRQLMAHS